MTEYQPGDIVNGNVWTGSEWVPVNHRDDVVPQQPARQPGPPASVNWKVLIAVLLVVAAVGGFFLWRGEQDRQDRFNQQVEDIYQDMTGG